MRVRSVFLAIGMLSLVMLQIACEPDRTDITANNKEYSGQYDVLSDTRQPDGTIVMRVKVANLSKAGVVARNLAHQVANIAQHGLVVEILGPEDAPTASPRQTLKWPGDIDYRAD